MRCSGLSIKRIVFALTIIFVYRYMGQTTQQDAASNQNDPDRIHAIELYKNGKFVEAMPLYESLVSRFPSDMAIREGWAWCLFEYAGTLTDSAQRKTVRVKARAVAVEAQKLGDNTQLLQEMLEQPEDGGSDIAFSAKKDIDDAMRAAEADYARGDLDKARSGYLRVLLMDPNNYEAALFSGDVCFKQHIYGSAGEWFARAIQINPNRETAYRYWGDALVAMGNEDEARSKYVDGIVSDPYSRRSWSGLENWLKRNKLELNNVRLKDSATLAQKDDKNTTITLDANLFSGKSDPNNLAWIIYAGDRALWKSDKFKKEFPNEAKYHRTLKEESDCLTAMIESLKGQKDYEKKYKDIDPSLQSLIKIQEAGFLDPFVLLNRADAEIAQDYLPYLANNRDKVRSYLSDFVVPKRPAK